MARSNEFPLGWFESLISNFHVLQTDQARRIERDHSPVRGTLSLKAASAAIRYS